MFRKLALASAMLHAPSSARGKNMFSRRLVLPAPAATGLLAPTAAVAGIQDYRGLRQAARYSIKSLAPAAGDGVTDDLAALVIARDKGLPMDGGGLTYGVNGRFDLIDGIDIANARFKQPNPAAGSDVRTIYSDNRNRTRLNDIIVDRNGDGTVGTISGGGAAGIYLVGGRDHHWGLVEVFG